MGKFSTLRKRLNEKKKLVEAATESADIFPLVGPIVVQDLLTRSKGSHIQQSANQLLRILKTNSNEGGLIDL